MRRITAAFAFLILLISPVNLFAEKITVTVKGMVCAFCAQGIKKTFLSMQEVKAIDVDLESKLVTVETREGASLTDEQIKKLLLDAGFDVVKTERSDA